MQSREMRGMMRFDEAKAELIAHATGPNEFHLLTNRKELADAALAHSKQVSRQVSRQLTKLQRVAYQVIEPVK